jgi:hypothetical protein
LAEQTQCLLNSKHDELQAKINTLQYKLYNSHDFDNFIGLRSPTSISQLPTQDPPISFHHSYQSHEDPNQHYSQGFDAGWSAGSRRNDHPQNVPPLTPLGSSGPGRNRSDANPQNRTQNTDTDDRSPGNFLFSINDSEDDTSSIDRGRGSSGPGRNGSDANPHNRTPTQNTDTDSESDSDEEMGDLFRVSGDHTPTRNTDTAAAAAAAASSTAKIYGLLHADAPGSEAKKKAITEDLFNSGNKKTINDNQEVVATVNYFAPEEISPTSSDAQAQQDYGKFISTGVEVTSTANMKFMLSRHENTGPVKAVLTKTEAGLPHE